MYVKVSKTKNTVYTGTLSDTTSNASGYYWLDIGETDLPDIYCRGDNIKFILDTPLTESELNNDLLIKDLDDGDYSHVISSEDSEEIILEQTNELLKKEYLCLFNEIILNCADDTQKNRILDLVDTRTSICLAIQNYDYDLARDRLLLAKNNSEITQDDYDLIDGIIPTYEE